MTDTEPLNNEVVADSEDENEMDLYHTREMLPPPVRETPSIYGFSPKRPPAASSISNFTAGQQIHTSIASAYSTDTKGKKADTSIDTFTADFENVSASIADRAKTRQRSQKRASDVIELSSDDNFHAFGEPAPPKAKARPKPKPKLKPKPVEKEAQIPTEPISTTSAAAPAQAPAQAPTSAPRPRPRPRPIIRRPPPIPADGDMGAPYPPTSTPPHGPELPIATSPFRPVSELPPSDLPFPVSSVSTTYNELYNNNFNTHTHNSSNIPRIEAIRTTRTPTERPSSPDSLFSERGAESSASKRRKTGVDTEPEIDELATPPQGSAFNFGGVSPSKMPPPPTFFAGSSSSSMGRGGEAANANAGAPAPFPIDLELDPPEPSLMIIDGPPKVVATKAAPKPKKPRKPKAVDEYEYDDVDFGAKPIVFDDDDMDCDFDPKEDGSGKKKKGKEKAKPREKKEKKEKAPKEPKEPKGKKKNAKADAGAGAEVVAVGADVEVNVVKDAAIATLAAGPSTSTSAPVVGRQIVEVVITHKPKTGVDKGKKKTKEKGKEPDAFKSREFIEHSDDDMDLIGPSRKSSSNPAAAASPSVVPAPASVAGPSTKPANEHPPPPIGSSSSSKKKPSSPASLGDDDDDLAIPNPTSSGGKRASVAGKKKRKSIVDSDVDDDGDFRQDADGEAGGGDGDGAGGTELHEPESSVSAAKKRKVDSSASITAEKSKKGKKKSTVVLSDDDAERPTSHRNKEKGATVGKKTTRKIVQDEEEEEEQIIVPEVKSTPPESDVSMKENVEPPSKPVYSTPKPTSAHRPSTTKLDNDAKTPLYARYEIAPRKSSLPMSELIRRANSIPGSPFATPHANTPVSASSKLKPLLTGTGRTGSTAYSPYMKASRSMLSRIAPLHPNRRTPPPPPPPPPPRKKSKKELEMEEKWEDEMIDDVGGMEAWAAMDDGERREMRKAKWARELGGWDE